MKRILFLVLFVPMILRGQNIDKLEYFFDTDPSFGNGVQVSITAAANIANFNFPADVSAVSTGFHTLYVRSRDANGKWSETTYRVFYKPAVTAVAPNVNKVEYYFDTDPGFGNGLDVPVTAALDIANFNFSADVSAVSTGFHTLYIRPRDANGKWSETAYRTFYKPAVQQPLPTIIEFEYFINTDPGSGNGVKKMVAIANYFQNFSFDACLLNAPQGANKLYIRAKDSNGKWSETSALDFTFTGTSVNDCTVLPIELIDFQAFKKEKAVQLQWQTATERNVSHFEIERNNDGIVFSKIMEEKARGGMQPTTYTVQDEPPQYGTHYYRLKIVDNDGKANYSKTVSLTSGKGLTVRVFPNPIQEAVTVEVSTEAKRSR
jgi:hypothetical protein